MDGLPSFSAEEANIFQGGPSVNVGPWRPYFGRLVPLRLQQSASVSDWKYLHPTRVTFSQYEATICIHHRYPILYSNQYDTTKKGAT